MSEALSRFMARVEFEPNTGCWLWTGAPGAGGYGVVQFGGRNQKAHRVSWALHNGEMPPPGVKLCHRCDTPACVNPEHLWPGSQRDNIADMVAKGRNRAPRGLYGTKSAQAALDEEQVWAIRHMLRLKLFGVNEIARSYGVSPMTISRIGSWQTWPHVHLNWPFYPHPLYEGKAA